MNIKNKKGFTLIEIAAIFTLIGVIIMVTVNFMNDGTKTDKVKEQLIENEKILNEFVGLLSNGYTVKTATESIQDNYTDVWGAKYELLSTPLVTDSNLCTVTQGSLLLDCNGMECFGWPQPDSEFVLTEDFLFAVVSGGPNLDANTGKIGTNFFGINTKDENIGYDDVYSFLTLSEVRAKLNCPAPTTLEFTTFSDISINTTTDLKTTDSQKAIITITGGSGEYNWYVKDVTATGMTTSADCSSFTVANSSLSCGGSQVKVIDKGKEQYTTVYYKANPALTATPQGIDFTVVVEDEVSKNTIARKFSLTVDSSYVAP